MKKMDKRRANIVKYAGDKPEYHSTSKLTTIKLKSLAIELRKFPGEEGNRQILSEFKMPANMSRSKDSAWGLAGLSAPDAELLKLRLPL